LWFLQAVDAPALEIKVREVRTRTIKIQPERGRIFDVKGRIVADNERILTLTIERAVISKPLSRQ
ncbi:MAG: penicillin-binding protein 2, partial [Actinomycetota bacterium]